MLVHFITDEPNKIPAIRAMLEPQYDVKTQLLGAGDTQIISNGVLMVDADLRKAVPVEQIKCVLQNLPCVSEKLFVVQSHLHHVVAQAYDFEEDWLSRLCQSASANSREVRQSQIPI